MGGTHTPSQLQGPELVAIATGSSAAELQLPHTIPQILSSLDRLFQPLDAQDTTGTGLLVPNTYLPLPLIFVFEALSRCFMPHSLVLPPDLTDTNNVSLVYHQRSVPPV